MMEMNKKMLSENCCHSELSSLPLLLIRAPSWQWACLPDIYALLGQWTEINHHEALGFLYAKSPDQEVRHTAVQWIDSISDAELLEYLPQLVQALKYECYLDSPLVRFLLKRAICDLKITHYFFWLLKDCLKDSQFSIRYQYLLAALLCCCGKGLREEFDRQCWLVNTLSKLAQKVREGAPSSRPVILKEGLEDVKQFFNVNGSCRLPLSPSLLVKGIVPEECSHFNSNAVPLKLAFQNVDTLGENIQIIFKYGDDLRQDMLTLQMIRIMNKIWVQEGLDMQMVIFRCFSTGRGRGDAGYPCYTWLMTPLARPHTRGECAFNEAHVKARSVIERAFGVLKSRFRCLDKSGGSLMYSPSKVARIITACAVLHNIANRHGLPAFVADDLDDPVHPTHHVQSADNRGNRVRRDIINNYFE